jgi:hypothetical protein
MEEIHDPLSEELNRLHAEHRRYAQRLDELIQKRTPHGRDGVETTGSQTA